MSTVEAPGRAILIGTLVLLALMPPMIFLYVALTSGLSSSEAFEALGAQYRSERTNLAVCTAMGMFPWVLLLLFLGVRRLMKRPASNNGLFVIAGSIPIVLVALYVNFEYWPTFLPDRTYAGFPHGLEFVIGPGIFAPIGMLVGFTVVWLMTRGEN